MYSIFQQLYGLMEGAFKTPYVQLLRMFIQDV